MTKFFGLSVLAAVYFSIFQWVGVAHSHKGVLGLTLLMSVLSVIVMIISCIIANYWRRIFPLWDTNYMGSGGVGFLALYIFLLIATTALSPIASLIFEAPTTVYYTASWIIMAASALFVFIIVD